MKIKTKVIIIIASITLLLCTALYIILHLSFLSSFSQIEKNLMQQNLERIKYAIENEENTLNKQSMDWGIWDDTYRFVEDSNQAYVEANFADQSFISIDTNIIVIINNSGELVFGENFDLEELAGADLSPELQRTITADSLLSREPEKRLVGILNTPEGPLLFGTSPILNSQGEGPVHGTILMGRFLDDTLTEKLSTITKLPITINTVSDPDSLTGSSNSTQISQENSVTIQPLDWNILGGSITLSDIYSRPVLTAGTQSDRDIFTSGLSMVMRLLIGMSIVAFLIILVNIFFLDKFILSRVKILRNFASSISKQGDFTTRVYLKGQDELTELGHEINAMLKKLFTVNERLAESESKYKLLVENQTDLLIEITPQGELLFVNPAYCKLMGKSKEELLGTRLDSLFHDPDSGNAIVRSVSNSSSMNTVYSEKCLLTQKGWRWIAWTGNGVLDNQGRVICLTCLGRDITESKLAKEELEKANQQLRELDKLKDNFLSTVSHELRTPLTSIKSFTEILLNYDEDKATQKEFLGIIDEESDRLTRLINDFLDLSKIQAGRMQWKTVEMSISEAIQPAVNISRPLIEKNKLGLFINIEPDLPSVMCDKDRLVQVITNLLGNAIKFTPENGRITIRAHFEKGSGCDQSDMIAVSIQDTGIGIAPENHQKIFENFGQVGDVLKDRPKGTGLGLPISKKIVENFGGKIWVESALGKGTTFLFSLPVFKKTASPVAPVVQPVNGKTILVVDDEAHIRRFIQHELSARGYNIIEASSGREALDLARKHHPDLITLDIAMPVLNGIDVTDILKKDPATRSIPILIITVFEDCQRVYTLGADDYITKPISNEVLLDRVSRLLERSSEKVTAAENPEVIHSPVLEKS